MKRQDYCALFIKQGTYTSHEYSNNERFLQRRLCDLVLIAHYNSTTYFLSVNCHFVPSGISRPLSSSSPTTYAIHHISGKMQCRTAETLWSILIVADTSSFNVDCFFYTLCLRKWLQEFSSVQSWNSDLSQQYWELTSIVGKLS